MKQAAPRRHSTNDSGTASLPRTKALGLSAAGQGLLELKLQQRMIKAKLEEINHKQDDLSRVIVQKMHDRSSSLYMGGPPLDASVRVDSEHSIRDYRYFTKQHKALAPIPNPPRLSTDSDVTMVRSMGFGPKIDDIQLRHKLRTDGMREVNRRTKVKQEKDRVREERKAKSGHTKRNVPPSMFPDRYLRGELPCSIEHGASGQYLSWVCPLENLDYDYYLPLFFDGLQCDELPMSFFVRRGIEDLLFGARGRPERIIPCLHKLVRPMRNALSKFEVPVLLAVLKALQQLIAVDPSIGPAMVQYYKMFLQPMNAFLEENKNLGDAMDFGQRFHNDVGEQVRNTLEVMERAGGPGAFKSIKFAIPVYQSCNQA